MRLSDFPDEPMYTLLVGDREVGAFQDWPAAWRRGGVIAPPEHRVIAPATRRAVEPGTLLTRYLAGEHVAVWEGAMALGPRVREEPYGAEARAIAAEMVRRARQNVETIIAHLRDLGYRF